MSKIVIEMEKINDMHCGLGQVAYHLGRNIHELDNDIFYYLPKNKQDLFPKHSQFIECKKLHRKIKFFAPKADVWHCLHQDSEYFPVNSNAKVILTIHDLNFLYENISEEEKNKRLSKIQNKIDRASAITYVSNFTKNEVEKNLNVKDKITRVIYNGVALSEDVESEFPSGMKFSNDFIFSIGTVVEKKNFHVLIDFIEKLGNQKLVIAGWKDNEYAKKIEETIADKNLSDRILLIGKVTESEKKWLYENCSSFVFPSVQEGFGLPVVEAMAHGKPTFISNYTSLPEVGGNQVVYFESFEPEMMAQTYRIGMHKYYEDSSLLAKLVERANTFSWKNAAKAYLDLYKSL